MFLNGIFCRSMRFCGAIPDKLGGVLFMFGAIAVLFILPWLDRAPVRSGRFRPLFKIFFWLFLADCVLLGYLGGKPAEGVYVTWSRLATAYYFVHFLLILPCCRWWKIRAPSRRPFLCRWLKGGNDAEIFCHYAVFFGLASRLPSQLGAAVTLKTRLSFEGVFGHFD